MEERSVTNVNMEYFIYTAREAWHVIGEFIVVSDVLLYIWRAEYV